MYLKKMIVVIMVAFAICFATGVYFDYKYKKNFATLFFDTTDTLLDTSKQYDLILLGNSRIHFGLNPFYIDSITNLSSYNFAVGGSNAEMLFLHTSLYLQNHPKPAYAVIGSDISFLQEGKAVKLHIPYLYYLRNDSFYKQFKKFHTSFFLAKHVPFLKYSFFDSYNRSFLFKEKKDFETFDHNIYKGFLNPHKSNIAPPLINFEIDDQPLITSQSSINLLRETILSLKNAGITIIVVSPPLNPKITIGKTRKFEYADSIFRKIALENKAIFLNAGDTSLYKKDFFTDDIHLNEPGTKVFSKELGMFVDSLHKQKKMLP
jgi:hypothetical protein